MRLINVLLDCGLTPLDTHSGRFCLFANKNPHRQAVKIFLIECCYRTLWGLVRILWRLWICPQIRAAIQSKKVKIR